MAARRACRPACAGNLCSQRHPQIGGVVRREAWWPLRNVFPVLANVMPILAGNLVWIRYVLPFCLYFLIFPECHMIFISIVLSLCFPQSSFTTFFLFLLMRRKITVTFHAHINTWDERGWEQNMASKLYPWCNNHYTNCFTFIHSQ